MVVLTGESIIFWLKYNLSKVSLHTRGLAYKGIFILPFGAILGIGIGPGLSAVTTMAPSAASTEDFYPRAILKFHYPNSLDYRVTHRDSGTKIAIRIRLFTLR